MGKGCNFFRWLDDDFFDERDLEIEMQKKKKFKLKKDIFVHNRMVENIIGVWYFRFRGEFSDNNNLF